MLKTILVAFSIFGFSFAWTQPLLCVEFYGNKSQASLKVLEKNSEKVVEIKNIELNKNGEVIRIDIHASKEIKMGESAVKLSDIINQIGKKTLASDVVINLTSHLSLQGKGEFFGLEIDINTNHSNSVFTLNLEQNINKLEAEQTFVSVLTEASNAPRVVINLSGEVKSMHETSKYEKQRCKT